MKYKKYFNNLVFLAVFIIFGIIFTYDTFAEQIAPVIISELLPNPEGKDSDGEWIELFNSSNESFDLSGWFLDDMEGGSKPYEIPLGTLIAPNSYLIFKIQDTKINLNNTGDSVRLLNPQKLVIVYAEYLDEAKDGIAYAFIENAWQWTQTPTPGAINSKPKILNNEPSEPREGITNTQQKENDNDIAKITKPAEKNNSQFQEDKKIESLTAEEFGAQIATNPINKKQLFIFIAVAVAGAGIGFGFIFLKNRKLSRENN